MGPLGIWEMVFLFVLALLIVGPRKLPELGRSIGKAMAEFRRASNELRSTFEREMNALEQEKQSFRSELSQVTASASDYHYAGSGDYTYDDYSYSSDPYASDPPSSDTVSSVPASHGSTSSVSAPQAAENHPASVADEPGQTPTKTESAVRS